MASYVNAMRTPVKPRSLRVVAVDATTPHPVERTVFGSAEPALVALGLEEALAEVGAVAEALFYRRGTGLVFGARLEDGREVVAKISDRARGAAFVEECLRVRETFQERGYPAPKLVSALRPFRGGFVVVDELCSQAPAPREAEPLARGLSTWMRIGESCSPGPALRRAWLTTTRIDEVWPSPFRDERCPTPALDAVASRLLEARDGLTGRLMLSHFDWRREHLAPGDDGAVLLYDWDSLHVELEPVAVGAAAHGFCSDRSGVMIGPAPTRAEVDGFVAAFEQARGTSFSSPERWSVELSLSYSLACTTRELELLGYEDPGFRALLESSLGRLGAGPRRV
jgi:hypothetical protein